MELKQELKFLLWVIVIFGAAFFLPVESTTFTTAIAAALDLAKWYAREHVVLCLLPAFFIAGVISIFVSQAAVLRYFGANARKLLAYSVASVSGAILAICSCTILPLFSSIHKRGAGLGPAITFLYSGPAINILAIILTARVLGFEMGVARTIGAISFSVIIGLIMSLIYRKEEKEKKKEQMNIQLPPEKRSMWQTAFHLLSLVFILVFANWGKPDSDATSGTWFYIWAYKWYITGFFSLWLGYSLIRFLKIKWQWVILAILATVASAWISIRLIGDTAQAAIVTMIIGIASLSVITLFDKTDNDNREWALASWGFAKQILPLLAIGVVTAGFLLGSTHDGKTIAGVIPNEWIQWLVGGNSILSNFFASIVGAFMYFATLTEVPILQGLIASGMGKGPALALLLSGPSLSLPSMLVIRDVMGTQKTLVYSSLTIVLSTVAGLIFGMI
ncbi:MAG: permease [Bacteroidales bacterium]|nr:permease [Bacteroidales bacterium]